MDEQDEGDFGLASCGWWLGSLPEVGFRNFTLVAVSPTAGGFLRTSTSSVCDGNLLSANGSCGRTLPLPVSMTAICYPPMAAVAAPLPLPVSVTAICYPSMAAVAAPSCDLGFADCCWPLTTLVMLTSLAGCGWLIGYTCKAMIERAFRGCQQAGVSGMSGF